MRTQRRSAKSGNSQGLAGELSLQNSEWIVDGPTLVLGRSQTFQNTLREVELVARHNFTILIEGESGTGKELLCRAVHFLSPRRGGPFVAVNCAALPRELLENELFGHRRGAYTDAHSEEGGLLTEAEGGTLFLDEIASLEIGLQSKLLRFLDYGEYRRIGDRQTRIADTRIVAACNTCLRTEAEKGRFRWDLYYRLMRYPLKLPPLRERPEDIPPLVNHFVRQYSQQFGLPPPRLSPSALTSLSGRQWPGNVRELENVILQAVLRHPGEVVEAVHLPPTDGSSQSGALAPTGALLDGSFQQKKAEVVRQFERTYLSELLEKHRGNISQAARAAGKHRRALMSLLNKHHLSPDLFRH